MLLDNKLSSAIFDKVGVSEIGLRSFSISSMFYILARGVTRAHFQVSGIEPVIKMHLKPNRLAEQVQEQTHVIPSLGCHLGSLL